MSNHVTWQAIKVHGSELRTQRNEDQIISRRLQSKFLMNLPEKPGQCSIYHEHGREITHLG